METKRQLIVEIANRVAEAARQSRKTVSVQAVAIIVPPAFRLQVLGVAITDFHRLVCFAIAGIGKITIFLLTSSKGKAEDYEEGFHAANIVNMQVDRCALTIFMKGSKEIEK